MKAHRGSRRIAQLSLKIGARWRWMVNVTLWPLLPRKEPRSTLKWRLGKPQGQFALVWTTENLLRTEFEVRSIQHFTTKISLRSVSNSYITHASYAWPPVHHASVTQPMTDSLNKNKKEPLALKHVIYTLSLSECAGSSASIATEP